MVDAASDRSRALNPCKPPPPPPPLLLLQAVNLSTKGCSLFLIMMRSAALHVLLWRSPTHSSSSFEPAARGREGGGGGG